jgi:DNA-binding protein YbaB
VDWKGPVKMSFGLNEELRAQLEELSENYERRLAEIRQLQQRAGQVTATARSRNGQISVEVGAQGQLLAISLDPSVYERLSPQRLAAAIIELARSAAAEAAEQVRQIMAPVLPPGGLPADGDFSKLLPKAPSLLDGEAAARPG